MGKRQRKKKGSKRGTIHQIPTDWIHYKGKDIFTHRNEKGNGKMTVFSVTIESGLIPRSSLDRRIAVDVPTEASLRVEKGDLVYNMMRMWQGALGLARESGVVSPAYVVIRPGKAIDSVYAFYLLKTCHYLHILKSFSFGLTEDRLRLYFKDFGLISFHLPSIVEQRAIAHLLTSWDKSIEILSKLIAQKELQKRWLSKLLLSGKKRLKGFKQSWVTTEVNKAFDFISTSSFSRENLTSDKNEGSILCVHYGDIHALYESDILNVHKEYRIPILRSAHNESASEFLKDGDLIMADASEDYEGVGESVELSNVGRKRIIGGLHTIVLRDKEKGITSLGFKGHLFNSEDVLNNLRRVATGTSVFSISKSSLSALKVNLPGLKEQEAITKVLNCADEEILLLRASLNKLVLQKKGLMEILFTGKKRIKMS